MEMYLSESLKPRDLGKERHHDHEFYEREKIYYIVVYEIYLYILTS